MPYHVLYKTPFLSLAKLKTLTVGGVCKHFDFTSPMQVLVDAVEDRAGGNHKVLAKKIASAPIGKLTVIIVFLRPVLYVYFLYTHICYGY